MALNVENVKLLLKHNANPNAKDSLGQTPMHLAVTLNYLPIVKLLDDFGGDATIQNFQEECPIDIALQEDHKELVLHFMS